MGGGGGGWGAEGLEIKRQCAHKRCTDRQTLADRRADSGYGGMETINRQSQKGGDLEIKGQCASERQIGSQRHWETDGRTDSIWHGNWHEG